MARISINIEAESAAELRADLEILLGGGDPAYVVSPQYIDTLKDLGGAVAVSAEAATAEAIEQAIKTTTAPPVEEPKKRGRKPKEDTAELNIQSKPEDRGVPLPDDDISDIGAPIDAPVTVDDLRELANSLMRVCGAETARRLIETVGQSSKLSTVPETQRRALAEAFKAEMAKAGE